jgi:hypothetical protein
MVVIMKLCKKQLLFITAIVAFFLVQNISAVELLPGNKISLEGTSFSVNSNLGGSVVRDQLIPFEIKNNSGLIILAGKVQDRVVRSTNTEQLIFAPRLRDLTSPNGDSWISSIRIEGYGNVATDVDFRSDGSGDVAPNNVRRDDLDYSILFNYNPNIISPPKTGKFLSLTTNVVDFCTHGSITITAQNDFGSNFFTTTLENTASPDSYGNCNVATVTTNLVISVPIAIYNNDDSTSSYWLKLDFKGQDDNGDYIWKLKDLGNNN